MNLTKELCDAIAEIEFDGFPQDVLEEARLCLLDWIGVTLGGAHEPLTKILMEVSESVGGEPQASIIGHARKNSMLNAALINGSASHALDFDDVHFQMMGHPTVPVMPALLALAEARNSNDGVHSGLRGRMPNRLFRAAVSLPAGLARHLHHRALRRRDRLRQAARA